MKPRENKDAKEKKLLHVDKGEGTSKPSKKLEKKRGKKCEVSQSSSCDRSAPVVVWCPFSVFLSHAPNYRYNRGQL